MSESRTTVDADPPPTPADALAIIERTQARTGVLLTPNLVLMHGVWGLAYVLGGVAYYLNQVGTLSGSVTVVVIAAVTVTAIAVSTVAGTRSNRGVRGSSGLQGALYGFSWPITLGAMGALVAGIAPLLQPDARGVVIPALFVFLVGVLYLASGSVWPNWPQYIGGTWTLLIATMSVFVPAPHNTLVLAIGAGGGFLALAAWFAARPPR